MVQCVFIGRFIVLTVGLKRGGCESVMAFWYLTATRLYQIRTPASTKEKNSHSLTKSSSLTGDDTKTVILF